MSHPLLDAFGGYTPFFYPLYKKSIFVFCSIVVDISKLSNLKFLFEVRTIPTIFSIISPHSEGVVVSGLGIGIGLIILAGIIIKWIGEKGEREKSK